MDCFLTQFQLLVEAQLIQYQLQSHLGPFQA